MSNLYREPSIDASYQVSIHLGKQFQRRRFKKNWPIRNKNCLWWPYLLMDWDEIGNLYRGPSIDASYQVSVHLAEGFQRKTLKCERLTDDGRQVMAKAHLAFCKVSSTKQRYMCISITNAVFISILIHISVIQFRYLYRDNCILNKDIYI